MKKKHLVYILTIVFSIVYILVMSKIAVGSGSVFNPENNAETTRAQVLRIRDREIVSYDEDGKKTDSMERIYFEAKALGGENKGKVLYCVQENDLLFALRPPDVEPGDKVLVSYDPLDDGSADYYLADHSRSVPLIVLCAVFFALLLLFGKKKGLDTIISLVFTCLAVFTTLLPAVLNGQNIYFWSIITCVFITVMTLLLVNGADIKSLSAGIGCVGGVLIAGFTQLIMQDAVKLTGMLDGEWLYLYNLNPENPIDLKAIIFAMIIIGAVGAVMDVAMSIASSLHEINEKSPDLSARELMRSGLTIGKDIMGTMANTLVLAYIGSSMTCVLLLISYSGSISQMINREKVAVEIIQALAGSLGILAALPLTAAVSVLLLKIFKKKRG